MYVAFSGALGYSFSQDDWSHLARARGLLPPLPGPWRSLSLAAFFEMARAPFGLDPFPYHVASLVMHAACSVLVYVFLSRRLAPAAACLAAVFFAAHPSQFTVAYWVSAIGDALALGFALAALCAIETRSRFRALAAPLFALSLLSKESTLFLPVVMLAAWWSDGGAPARWPRPPWRDLVWWACVVLAGCAALDILLGRVTESTADAGAYSFGLGAHVAANALTYLGWALNLIAPSPREDARSLVWGAAALLLWATGLVLLRRRRRAWIAATIAWLAWMAPVLGLRHHTVHYYQYVGLSAVAWMVGAAFDAAWAPRRRAMWIAAAACMLLVIGGRLAAQRIERATSRSRLAINVTIRRALAGDRIHQAIRVAGFPPGTTLTLSAAPSPDTTGFSERNMRSATQEGVSIRLLFPQIDSVAFGEETKHGRTLIYRADGTAVVR